MAVGQEQWSPQKQSRACGCPAEPVLLDLLCSALGRGKGPNLELGLLPSIGHQYRTGSSHDPLWPELLEGRQSLQT